MSVEAPVSVEVILARAAGAATKRTGDVSLPLLPLLEHPWKKVVSDLVEIVTRIEALKERGDLVEDVVAFALRGSSDYWAGLALVWVDDGFPVSNRIEKALLSASRRDVLSQKNRHAAWRHYHRSPSQPLQYNAGSPPTSGDSSAYETPS